jgi:hypothetical protein
MPVLIPVHRLKGVCNPFVQCVWTNTCKTPITRLEVEVAIRRSNLQAKPYRAKPKLTDVQLAGIFTRAWHVQRVAYLVVNGWEDPIHIDVGVPEFSPLLAGHWYVPDGNHRVAAAIYRGDSTILAKVDGSLRKAGILFGVDCEEK